MPGRRTHLVVFFFVFEFFRDESVRISAIRPQIVVWFWRGRGRCFSASRLLIFGLVAVRRGLRQIVFLLRGFTVFAGTTLFRWLIRISWGFLGGLAIFVRATLLRWLIRVRGVVFLLNTTVANTIFIVVARLLATYTVTCYFYALIAFGLVFATLSLPFLLLRLRESSAFGFFFHFRSNFFENLPSVAQLLQSVAHVIRAVESRNQLFHPLVRHRLRQRLRIGGQLAKLPRGWKLDFPRKAVPVEAEVEFTLCIRMKCGRISVVMVLLHCLVKYAVICEHRLQQDLRGFAKRT